jgi:hypothetical protein
VNGQSTQGLARASHVSERAVLGAVLVILSALTVILYGGTCRNGLYKDDYEWVADARDLAGRHVDLLHSNAENTEVVARPVQRLDMAATWVVTRENSLGYHVLSLLLHVLAATLLYGVLRQWMAAMPGTGGWEARGLAAAGAVAFVTTSHHLMAVAWIAAQSTLLVTALLLACLWVAGLPGAAATWWRRAAAVAVCFLLALWSKSTAVAFPFVLAAWTAVHPRGRDDRRRWLTLAGLLLAVGLMHVWWTRSVVGKVDLGELIRTGRAGQHALSRNTVANLLGTWLSCLIAPVEYRYFQLTVVPYPLAAVVALVAWMAAVWRQPYRAQVGLGILWALALALPTAGFNYEQFSESQITVNRYAYTPMAGVVIAAVFSLLALLRRIRRPRLVWGLVGLALVSFVIAQAVRIGAETVYFHDYAAPRDRILGRLQAEVGTHIPRRSVIVLFDWLEDESVIRSIGRLYFDPLGVRVMGEKDFVALNANPAENGVRRFLVRYDEPKHGFVVSGPFTPSTAGDGHAGGTSPEIAPSGPPRPVTSPAPVHR